MVANKVVMRHTYFVTPNADNFRHQLVVDLCDLVLSPGSPHGIASRTERHASVDRSSCLQRSRQRAPLSCRAASNCTVTD
jgi:hypothetical protein